MVVDVEFQVAKGLDRDRASKCAGCMRGALVQSDVIHRLRVECRRRLGFKQPSSGELAWWGSRKMDCRHGRGDEGRRSA